MASTLLTAVLDKTSADAFLVVTTSLLPGAATSDSFMVSSSSLGIHPSSSNSPDAHACALMTSSRQSSSVSCLDSNLATPSSTVMTCVGSKASQNFRSCDTTTTAPWNARKASVRLSMVSTSRWLEGSSSSSMLWGVSAKHASATRAFSPPLSLPISRTLLSWARPSEPMTFLTSVTVRSGLYTHPAFCTTSTPVSSIGRSWAKSCLKKPSTSPSPSFLSPALRASSPAIALSIVLLPAPLGPRTTTRMPFSIMHDTPVTMGSLSHPKAASSSCSCSKWQGGGLGRLRRGRLDEMPSGSSTRFSLMRLSCFRRDCADFAFVPAPHLSTYACRSAISSCCFSQAATFRASRSTRSVSHCE
mmetsp:Transcript_43493/g.72487  ORF Transcript_43493/g.72487 Transcript_43493/m.72487 type:complete len:359 (-) Transcript_43493:1156-2232(-)